jgi:DNA mismatch endonuclease (patch repair protein)
MRHRRPTSNEDYWNAKVARNRARDIRVTKDLRLAKWRVLRVWEHELRLQPAKVAARLLRALERT